MSTHIYRSIDSQNLCLPIQPSLHASDTHIRVDHQRRYQYIDGFGASFTDSSAHLMSQLGESARGDAMKALFDPFDGIGLSVLRNPMGACDYSRYVYSYDDGESGEPDLTLQEFSVAHDDDAIIPLTRRAMEINPELKMIASPWSAPAWMKTTRSMMTGQLEKKYYGVYASYFVRFIQEYALRKIPVFAVTPQNEPLYEPSHYPSMLFPAMEEAEFVREHLRPAFDEHGIKTRILGYDHNWDVPEYSLEILRQAGDAFDGIAWHWYGGDATAQSEVLKIHPDKDVYFTEGSGGSWIPEFEPAFSNLMRQGIDILRNGSKTFLLWNIALNEHNGPVVPGFGDSTCRALLRIHNQSDEVEYTLDYYGLAHFSKFIRPGAVRIQTVGEGPILHVGFENKNNSTVVVLFNDSAEFHVVAVNADNSSVNIEFPPHSAVTVVSSGDVENA